MNVSELIAHLQTLPADMRVFVERNPYHSEMLSFVGVYKPSNGSAPDVVLRPYFSTSLDEKYNGESLPLEPVKVP